MVGSPCQSRFIDRRTFNSTLASLAASCLTGDASTDGPDKARPGIPAGMASGDVTAEAAVIWSRTDRPARMTVEYATTRSFRNSRSVTGPEIAQPENDFTAKVELSGLPPGQRICYRVWFHNLTDAKQRSPVVLGSFRTAPRKRSEVFFAWSGDTCGQGFGINPEWGGMKIYETMRKLQPDFFIHSGDHIYADNPIRAEVQLADGSLWKNLVTPAKAKVAETLAEFRGNYAYNLLDENLRRFNAEVAQIVQWDDHETLNNWYPGKLLDDDRYQIKDCSVLAERARRAFFEYLPIRPHQEDRKRIYRAFPYGPALELFVLDQRSYRGPNSPNRQPTAGPTTAFLGPTQLAWLKQGLKTCRSTWKIICSDMPIGLIVGDSAGKLRHFENSANGDPGQPLGRELEFADLFRFIRDERIKNVVWLTADVHYAAAHYYHSDGAGFGGKFEPFWEFVAGPLNAGTFGPGELDRTFGPQVKFQSVPKGMRQNRPPSDGLQFFGTVHLDGTPADVLTVSLHNLRGEVIYTVDLVPTKM